MEIPYVASVTAPLLESWTESELLPSLVTKTACQVLAKKRICVWDTESDAPGAVDASNMVREWYLVKLDTRATLHIRRSDPDYDPRLAAKRIVEFIKDVDFVVGYEPSHCDRNRLFALAGELPYQTTSKFIDLYRLFMSSIISFRQESKDVPHLPDLRLSTVYNHLFSVSQFDAVVEPRLAQDLLPTKNIWAKEGDLLPTKNIWDKEGDKCTLDVHQLANLVLVLRHVVNGMHSFALVITHYF